MENNFLDDLLLEVEQKEKQLVLKHGDLVLKEIASINADIARILSQAEEERQIITDWSIERSAKLSEKVSWLSLKLQIFFDEQYPDTRTLDLAHGQLTRRKQIEKLVVEYLDQFLLNNNLAELTSTTPEVVKPDLTKIKSFYKMTGKIPLGTSHENRSSLS